MISSAATPATGEPRNGRGESPHASSEWRPTASRRSQIAGTSLMSIQWYWMFCRSVTSAVSRAKSTPICAQGADRGRREQLAVGADPQHEVAVVELLLLEGAGLAAVDAGLALGVETHPAHPATEVGGVDRVEAALGVDVEDPVADVEGVVVLLRLLVLVQRLAVAERPLALGAAGARHVGVTRRLRIEAQVRHGGWWSFADGARTGARLRSGSEVDQRGQHIMLRVRPRSTWRRTTRNAWVAAETMSMSLSPRTVVPQIGIS